MRSRIDSVGLYIPERELTNSDLVRILAASGQETSEDWIVSRTGMTKRRIAEEHETVESMVVNAAKDALERLGPGVPAIEHIIVATNTAERMFPNVSGFVQAELLESHPMRIVSSASGSDTHGGCGGINLAFMYADSLIKSRFYRSVLVIGAEKLSAVTDYSDRETCILFGDGASAYVLTRHDGVGGFMGHEARGKGVDREMISCEENAEKVTFFEALKAVLEARAPGRTRGRVLRMDGTAVYKYVGREWQQLLEGFSKNRALNPEGITYEELAAISPHLANFRMFSSLDEGDYPGFLRRSGLNRLGENDLFYNSSTASQGRRDRQFLESAGAGDYLLKFGYGAELMSCANLYKMHGQ